MWRARGLARFLAINDSWRLCPWAGVLYACDLAWWRAARCEGFSGLTVSGEGPHPAAALSVDIDPAHRMVFDRPGVVGSGECSGFQALNLAVLLGARRVILVGFDARTDLGGHWHADHGQGLNNPTGVLAARWAAHLDAAAPDLLAAGVEVVNASPVSALCAYPRRDFAEWAAMLREVAPCG